MSVKHAKTLLKKLSNDIEYFRKLADMNNKERLDILRKDGFSGFTKNEYMEALVEVTIDLITNSEIKYKYYYEDKKGYISKIVLPTYSAFDPEIKSSRMDFIGETLFLEDLKTVSEEEF
jgi:hypothetical protein